MWRQKQTPSQAASIRRGFSKGPPRPSAQSRPNCHELKSFTLRDIRYPRAGKTGLMLEDGDGKGKAPLLLDAANVRHLHLRSLQLAVLSACSTAAAGGGSSQFDSVTDAFLSAGVPHVVASRWAVDSSETRAFVEDFYYNALSGETVSEATRLTSRKMLALPHPPIPIIGRHLQLTDAPNL